MGKEAQTSFPTINTLTNFPLRYEEEEEGEKEEQEQEEERERAREKERGFVDN